MRFQKDDDYGPLSAELEAARARVEELTGERARRAVAWQTEVSRPAGTYSEHAVAEARRELAGVDARLGAARDRAAALEAALPGEAARAEALAEVGSLDAQVGESRQRFTTAWGRLRAAAEAAGQAARDVCAARESARLPLARIEDLRLRFGLDVPAPRPLAPTVPEEKLLAALGLLIAEAAHGEPRDIVLQELDDARSKVA